MRKKQREEQLRTEREERLRAESGNRLARLRESKFCPPSCVTREKRPREVVLHIEVAVYPGK